MGTPIRYFQVDAFTSELFKGNPAGVCVLEGNEWLPDDLMQRIAAENNLAETAFVLPQRGPFGLRWFTPTVEIDLCGHATLASAFVMFSEYKWDKARVEFSSKSGTLAVERKGEILELDFPSRPAPTAAAPNTLIEAVGSSPAKTLKARDWLFVYDSPEQVLALRPNFKAMGTSVIATAQGSDVDFVSRFFAPNFGIDEDPVTGSAHSTLIPYWAGRLGKTKLRARQVSARGGELLCELRGDRVGIGGHAVLYSSGHLHI
ncbi:MAG TPA: PhzF family phenazine biosynthesis protein [Verrucomicrobiae bacterium]|nr:PhzF family phenazine biosynthesis protein [Verrucomicrobiae bacterium]